MGAALSRKNAYDPTDNGLDGSGTGAIALLAMDFVGTPYSSSDSAWISIIAAAAFLSALSILFIFITSFLRPSLHLGGHTHIKALFGSLLFANLLQAIGTLFNTQWVINGGLRPGAACSAQGGIKQAGNVGSAFWSFMLSAHAFSLLFLRNKTTKRGKWLVMVLGWTLILFVVVIGPLAIQNKENGPYFGPSGYWCWITDAYPAAQTFLEYFFEWMSALFSFLLYTVILLRVRGNLVRKSSGRWSLLWVPRSESWQLSMTRDYLDSSMVRVVTVIVWFPVAYTLLIAPITIARFASYAGAHIPQGFIFFADIIYGLGGFTNLLLLLATRRLLPDLNTLPDFTTPRPRHDKDAPAPASITPFVLTAPPADAEKPLEEGSTGEKSESGVHEKDERRRSADSAVSVQSFESRESQMPLTGAK
ncbi:hypothetical protein FA95DRAFT_1568838 [Auriscalpium vulgare]|uniref:Uncharacterized protein n=1 Tax=Auriscalpium vulgare TaxID=40419 RepID=A0ACB8SAI0_9AGAM|nr:hypothetical protein FA95DRAFT_1568838 [Auriscalpium vulgare]